jgi:hypothetical protein
VVVTWFQVQTKFAGCDDDPIHQCVRLLFTKISNWLISMTQSRYESESLGVFEEPPAEEDEEPTGLEKLEPRERIGRYLVRTMSFHQGKFTSSSHSSGTWTDKCQLVGGSIDIPSAPRKNDSRRSPDIWWLVWGVFLVAVIERHNLLDEDKKWFDMFRIVFELVSAFGGIGLSLGVPYVSLSHVSCVCVQPG